MNNPVQDPPKFNNLQQRSSGSWRVAFKTNRKQENVVYPTLLVALTVRNAIYKEEGRRPAHLLVPRLTMDIVRRKVGRDRNGKPYVRWRIYARYLSDRQVQPRGFMTKKMAEAFARKYIAAYNRIARLYNEKRQKAFQKAIKEELQTLRPCVETGFDLALWQACATQVYGSTIPCHFSGDGYERDQTGSNVPDSHGEDK